MPSSKLFFLFSLYVLHVESTPRTKNELLSPCPHVFTYETNETFPDKWYGTITLDNDAIRQGLSLRISFDRPSLQLGNWLGPVKTNNNLDYVIENYDWKTNERPIIRFYVKYNPSRGPPRLVSLEVNNKRVCPEETLQTEREVQVNNENEDVNSICGTVVKRNVSKNSNFAEEGEFPWHAALYHTKGINLGYICGATLISNLHVITAAHCITERRSQDILDRTNLVVYLGKHYLKRFSRSGIVQDRQVIRIFPHPSYNARTYRNNIALVKFTMPVDFTDYIRPICLWKESADLNSVINKQGTVVGWDIDSSNKSTETLQKINLPVVSQETCINSYPDIYSRFTSNNSYCAGSKNGPSVCNGDYGAGMFFPKLQTNLKRAPLWQLRGLVSIIINLGDPLKCDASKYVIFEDAAKHLDWIINTMTI